MKKIRFESKFHVLHRGYIVIYVNKNSRAMSEIMSVNERLAINVLGLSYVKIPRFSLDLLTCPDTRQLGLLHIMLFEICFFKDGYVKMKDRKVPCKRGEYVGTQQQLADLSGISIGSINRLIRKLEAMHLISVTKIQGGSLIKVHGYTTLIAEKEVQDTSSKSNISEEK